MGISGKKDFYHRRSQSSYAQVPFYVHGNTASYHEFNHKSIKKRSQIHPGRCYERSKKNRDRKHTHTRKSVL